METPHEENHSLELRYVAPEAAGGRLKIWPEIGEVELDGKTYYLTKQLTLFLEVLATRMPRVVPYEHLITQVWGHDLDSAATQVDVTNAAARLRKKFQFSSLQVSVRWGFGFSLSLGED